MATLTGNSRRREQRLQDLMLTRQSKRFERRLSREIARTMRRAADNFEAGRIAYTEAEAERHERTIGRLLTDMWYSSGKEMSEHILGVRRSRPGALEFKREGIEVEPTQVMDRVMSQWIARQGAIKITQISKTTMSDVRSLVQQGITEGLSEREIGRMIKRIAPTKSASRAQTIARTEVHSASQFAAQASAEAIGLPMVRVWLAVQDGGERTREDHLDIDGQRRGMHEPFDVGGTKLMYPGDPAGPAEQVINCRCVVVFELES